MNQVILARTHRYFHAISALEARGNPRGWQYSLIQVSGFAVISLRKIATRDGIKSYEFEE
jgi:hypothetical protein